MASLARSDLDFNQTYSVGPLIQSERGITDEEVAAKMVRQECRFTPIGGVQSENETLDKVKAINPGSVITAEMMDDLLDKNPRLAAQANESNPQESSNWILLTAAILGLAFWISRN